jgi:transcriptional regulator with XRE-family HTH domain
MRGAFVLQFGMHSDPTPLILTLQQARRARRLSQLELSMRLGVSQRHISFVESGRAKPSRELLLQWLHELGVPLAVSNQALMQAGFAPAYSAAALDDPQLQAANAALDTLLRAHDPMPAFVLDARWNVLKLNRGGTVLAQLLMPKLFASLLTQGTPNMLQMLLHEDGLCQHVTNMSELGPNLLAHLRQEALVHPALLPDVERFAEQLRIRLGERALKVCIPTAPVLTTRFLSAHGELAFFSMFTTFGQPHDITLSSLRVEHMFAANAQTKAVMADLAASG